MADDSQPDYRPEAEPRPIPGMMPTCPLCGVTNSPADPPELAAVQRTLKGEPLAERFPYTCGKCWTVFAGTDQEWQRMREQRESYGSVRDRITAEGT